MAMNAIKIKSGDRTIDWIPTSKNISSIKESYNENIRRYYNQLENAANATAAFPQDRSQWTSEQKTVEKRYLDRAASEATKAKDRYETFGGVEGISLKEFPKDISLSQDSKGNFVGTYSKSIGEVLPGVPGGPQPTTASAAEPMSISFKDGLNDIQKQGLTALSQKPIDQWTETDKANWAYGTNGSSIPGTSIGPTRSSAGSNGSTGGSIGTGMTGDGSGDSTGSGSGVDQTGWTDSMKQLYDAMSGYVDTITKSGKIVNPDITIDDNLIAQFTAQAKTELGDYYKPLFDQTASDIKTGLQRIGEDLGSYTTQLSKQFGSQLENTQESFARRGLNFSSDRNKAETNLADTYATALAGKQQDAQRSAYDLGVAGVRKLGSSFFPSETASYLSGQTPTLGKAGVYGFSNGTKRNALFDPTSQGDVYGTLQGDQKYAETSRVNDLTNAERELRSNFYA